MGNVSNLSRFGFTLAAMGLTQRNEYKVIYISTEFFIDDFNELFQHGASPSPWYKWVRSTHFRYCSNERINERMNTRANERDFPFFSSSAVRSLSQSMEKAKPELFVTEEKSWKVAAYCTRWKGARTTPARNILSNFWRNKRKKKRFLREVFRVQWPSSSEVAIPWSLTPMNDPLWALWNGQICSLTNTNIHWCLLATGFSCSFIALYILYINYYKLLYINIYISIYIHEYICRSVRYRTNINEH